MICPHHVLRRFSSSGVSDNPASRDLGHVPPAHRPPHLPQLHPGHQGAPQGPAAHPHQVLQRHGPRKAGV